MSRSVRRFSWGASYLLAAVLATGGAAAWTLFAVC